MERRSAQPPCCPGEASFLAWLVELPGLDPGCPSGQRQALREGSLGSWLCPISPLCGLLSQSGDTFLWPFIILAFAIVKYKK